MMSVAAHPGDRYGAQHGVSTSTLNSFHQCYRPIHALGKLWAYRRHLWSVLTAPNNHMILGRRTLRREIN